MPSRDNPALEALRPVLFGEAPLEKWPLSAVPAEPWTSFVKAREHVAAGNVPAAIEMWRTIAATPGLESRHALQAWFFLRSNGVKPDDATAVRLLAAVADVPVDDAGRDLLVGYSDGSARYFNHSGGSAIVEADVPWPVREAVSDWVEVAQHLAERVGIWEGPLPPLGPNESRLLMLTPGGPRFGQGTMDALMSDRLGQGYVRAAVAVIEAITTLQTRS